MVFLWYSYDIPMVVLYFLSTFNPKTAPVVAQEADARPSAPSAPSDKDPGLIMVLRGQVGYHLDKSAAWIGRVCIYIYMQLSTIIL